MNDINEELKESCLFHYSQVITEPYKDYGFYLIKGAAQLKSNPEIVKYFGIPYNYTHSILPRVLEQEVEPQLKSAICQEPWAEYCPLCARIIIAENRAEVEAGEHEGYIFVHDEGVEHSDEDIEALQKGVQ